MLARAGCALAIVLLLLDPCRAIWPAPQRITLGPATESISVGVATGFKFVTTSASTVLKVAIERYEGSYLFPLGLPAAACEDICLCNAQLLVASDQEELQMGIDEAYNITITSDGNPAAVITANTVYGAMRALETFAQMLEWDDQHGTYAIKQVPILIEDWPRFPWRGLLIDSGRHFLTMEALKRMIATIAMNKMNVMHWHISDSQSFPLRLKSVPLLAEKGAYSLDYTYSTEDVQELVAYARSWGVRIVPELDMPTHVLAWSDGYPWATIKGCVVANDMVPFNVIDEDLYSLLDAVFAEIAPLFPDAYIHIGGDEVKTFCWDRDPASKAWMKANNMTSGVQLWRYFALRLRSILEKHGWGKFVMWYEMFQNDIPFGDLNTTFTEVWMDPDQSPKPVAAGRKILLAGGWYLDRQVPDRYNAPNYLWVDTWVNFWRNEPYTFLKPEQQSYLYGGEGAMFGENVDSANLDGRVWPRAAGISERLWSAAVQATPVSIEEARTRLVRFRCRMAQVGIKCGPVKPDYCPLAMPSNIEACPITTRCSCMDVPELTTTPSTTLPSGTCPVPHTLPACSQSPTSCAMPPPVIPTYMEVSFIVAVVTALVIGAFLGVIGLKFATCANSPAYVQLRIPTVEAREADDPKL